MISSRIDWYSFTYDLLNDHKLSRQAQLLRLNLFVDFLSGCVSSCPYSFDKGFYRGRSWVLAFSDSLQSFLVGANWVDSEYRDSLHVFVELRGSFLSRLSSYQNQLELDKHFLENCLNLNYTRLDLCLDDFARRILFDDVCQVGIDGFFLPFEKFKLIQSDVRGSDASALTCYFGSDLKSLRFYNSELVHGIEADRWELQLRDQYARNALDMLRSGYSPESLILGSIKFEDLQGWDSLCSESSVLHCVPSDPFDPSLAKILAWLENQVAPSLAVVSKCYQSAFTTYLASLLAFGESRLRPYHKSLIQSYLSNQEISNG